MRTTPGTFPIRLKAVPGEALDSWLEAFAHRLHTPLGDVLNDLGLLALEDGLAVGSSSTEMLTRRLSPVMAASIAQVTGTPVAALHAMTLAHYDQRILDLDPRSGLPQSATRWGKSTGARFCTDCLAESGGRWQLAWRLGWSFACVRHNRLLADHCPQCRSRQRTRALATREIPHPGHCPNTSSADGTGPGRRRCDADLAQAATPLLDADHPVLDAQRLVYAMTDSGTAAFGPYADHPQSALGALADLRALVGEILHHAPRQYLAERLPAGLPMNTDELNALLTPADVGIQSLGMHTPKSVAMTAAGVVLAVDILSRPDIQQAGTSARWIIQAERESRPSPGRSLLAPWGTGTTEVLRAVQLAAIGPQLQAVYQLRYRVQTFHPGTRPDHIPVQRLRSLPAALWAELALPLAPPELHDHRIMRPALSCLIGLVGNRQSIDVIAERLGQATTGFMSSRMLGHLREHQQWPDIQAALVHIADYLDTCPAPIDYERRRRLDYTLLLPDGQWFDIARQCDIVRSTGTLARLFRSYVFLRISGLPARMAPSTCTPENNSARSQHAMRYLRLTPELLAHLDHAAEDFLQRNRITDEPVTWYPPDNLLQDLGLPGHRPSEIDIYELHSLIRQDEMTATQAAAHLQTTIDVVRCLLDRHPAPDTSERRSWPAPVSDPVREVLDSATFARLYIDQRMSLRAIGELYGVQADVIRGIAAEYKIPIRTPKEYRHRREITREWLHEQYVTRRRTLADIAEETGMTMSNVAKWVRTHEIPLRPRGGASHDESLRIRERARQAPRLLRPALNGLAAEERLRRFVKASAYPTLGAAARDMGVNGPTLVTQINRLARELGAPLLERAERGRPMKLTPLGKRVVRAATSWLSEA